MQEWLEITTEQVTGENKSLEVGINYNIFGNSMRCPLLVNKGILK